MRDLSFLLNKKIHGMEVVAFEYDEEEEMVYLELRRPMSKFGNVPPPRTYRLDFSLEMLMHCTEPKKILPALTEVRAKMIKHLESDGHAT